MMDTALLTVEVQRLQLCINNLVSVLALPAMWVGGEAEKIADSLPASLLRMLDLDLVYLRLNSTIGDAPREVAKAATDLMAGPEEIGTLIEPWLDIGLREWPPRFTLGGAELSIMPLRLGLQGEIGILITGCRRKDFPQQTEALILSVAANQATIGLQGAQLLSEQKRVAEELDRRVEHRTIELEQASEALAANERRLEQIINTIPAMAWSANPDGNVEFFNKHHLDYVGLAMKDMQGTGFVSTFHPHDVESLMGAWQVMLESGHGGEVEGRIRRADGEYRWCLFRTNPLRDASGQVVKWFGVNIDIEDRKRSDERLRTSELNLRQQTETIPQMLWGATPDGAIDYCNAQLLNYTGSRPDQILGAGWLNVVHPDDRDRSVAIWLAAVNSGEPYHCELRVRHIDGQYRWCVVDALPLRDQAGHILKWHGTSVDIHDLEQAQEALAASERNLAQIINRIPALAWTARADGSAEFLNQHYLDYVGLSIEQAAGNGWTTAVHPDDLDGLIATWQSMLLSCRSGEAEARVRRFDGEYRWFLFRSAPLFDERGDLIKWFGINVDIEDRKRAEEALRASEGSLRQLTETIPQMLWSAKPDGSIDYCNARLLEFTGFSFDEVLGGGWTKMLHPDDVEPTKKAWLVCIETGAPYNVEVRTIHPADGTYRWVWTNALPLRDDEGRIVKWHGSCVDVHDWKQAQDDLRDTQAELAHMTRVMTMGHLTASIAHELNQPLAGIITNASTCLRMLAADPPNVVGARETARRTIRDGNRAAEVINRLRALFSKRKTAIEAVDLNTTTQEVIALTLTELQRAGVNLCLELADDLPLVKGDRVQLQQVIMNLILNAVEAMHGLTDRPKELVIATQRDGTEHVLVVVQDAGVGFDSTTAQKLFNPFYTTKSHGMGIGLSVSRSIIENHQGRLWAEANEGPGARFFVSIPTGPDRSGLAGHS